MIEDSLVDRFVRLFAGNTRSFGRWLPETGKVITEKRAINDGDWKAHFAGTTGAGSVPILDDATCWFGCIDIDNHKSKVDIDLPELEAKIKRLGYPLVLCRSKSGGAHCFIFGLEPLDAKLLKKTLTRWAKDLGHPDYDIFPKQDALAFAADGTRALGNWINLPYCGNEKSNRYAIRNGQRLDLADFIEYAEVARVTQSGFDKLLASEMSEAPPCLQCANRDGIEAGLRNNGLYQYALYFKKSAPEHVLNHLVEINNKVLEKPLPFPEVQTIAKSVMKSGTYKYKCKDEPFRSNCNSALCVTREFGISKSDHDDMVGESELPEFIDLMKYDSEPVRWAMKVGGLLIDNLSTDELMSYPSMCKRIMERLHVVLPPISNRKWQRDILGPLLMKIMVEDMPVEAGVSGRIMVRITEYLKKTDLTGDPKDKSRRQILDRGMPVLQDIKGSNYVVFRGVDFLKYLKEKKADEGLKGLDVYQILRRNQCRHAKLRAGAGAPINVWMIAMDESLKAKVEAPNMNPEY